MTVPETPSPDVVAAKRNHRHNLARQATIGAMKAKSKQVQSLSLQYQRVRMLSARSVLAHEQGHMHPLVNPTSLPGAGVRAIE